MTEQEFWHLLDEIFGRVYGRSLSADQQIPALDGMSAQEALRSGVEPRVVWNELCEHMGVSDAHRWGSNHVAPPLPTDFRTDVRVS